MNRKLFFANLLLPCLGIAQDETIQLSFKAGDLIDVLRCYSTLTGRKTWVDVGVHAKVTLVTPQRIPKQEALELIHNTLLEKYGIELLDGDKNESFVSWSDDPQYQEVRIQTEKGNVRPVIQLSTRKRIRI